MANSKELTEQVMELHKKQTEEMKALEEQREEALNTIWSRKYYLAALTDATKAVKIFKGTATATADTTVSEGKVYYAKTDNGYIVGKPKTKGTKAQPYVEEAYPINKKTVEEAELKKEKAKSEKGLRYMQAYMVQANKQLQERK